jgi:hypothetical protein
LLQSQNKCHERVRDTLGKCSQDFCPDSDRADDGRNIRMYSHGKAGSKECQVERPDTTITVTYVPEHLFTMSPVCTLPLNGERVSS